MRVNRRAHQLNLYVWQKEIVKETYNMKRNVKKVVASLMASMTVMSTIATSSFAEGNGRIGVKFYYLGWGDRVYVGDCNQDGEINVADLVSLRLVGDMGYAFWNAEKIYDCNGDHYVNDADYEALKSYLVSH